MTSTPGSRASRLGGPTRAGIASAPLPHTSVPIDHPPPVRRVQGSDSEVTGRRRRRTARRPGRRDSVPPRRSGLGPNISVARTEPFIEQLGRGLGEEAPSRDGDLPLRLAGRRRVPGVVEGDVLSELVGAGQAPDHRALDLTVGVRILSHGHPLVALPVELVRDVLLGVAAIPQFGGVARLLGSRGVLAQLPGCLEGGHVAVVLLREVVRLGPIRIGALHAIFPEFLVLVRALAMVRKNDTHLPLEERTDRPCRQGQVRQSLLGLILVDPLLGQVLHDGLAPSFVHLVPEQQLGRMLIHDRDCRLLQRRAGRVRGGRRGERGHRLAHGHRVHEQVDQHRLGRRVVRADRHGVVTAVIERVSGLHLDRWHAPADEARIRDARDVGERSCRVHALVPRPGRQGSVIVGVVVAALVGPTQVLPEVLLHRLPAVGRRGEQRQVRLRRLHVVGRRER